MDLERVFVDSVLGLSWTIAAVDLDDAFLPMEHLGVGLFL